LRAYVTPQQLIVKRELCTFAVPFELQGGAELVEAAAF
jgi:hypothetical protein